MRVQVRIDDRVVSCLDSAPSTAELAQDVTPATPADAALPFSPRNALLLLHAFPLNAAMWEAQVAAPPPGWRVLAPDMRGCGQSQADRRPDSPTLSLDDYARDVLALLDRFALERVVVGGLSMGGYTAFALLRLAPSRVAGLVLSNTKTEADSEEAKRGRLDALRVLDGEGVRGLVEGMSARLLGRTTRLASPCVEQTVRSIAEGNGVDGVRAAIIRLRNRPDSADLLPAIACPALVIASDEDVVTPIDHAETMQRNIPRAELAIIRGAGHLSNLEQPEQFGAAIWRFLARLGG